MSPRKSPKPDRDPEDHICPSLSQISGDGDRLNALYSPFRPRETNPESYDQKLRFWTKVLAEWVNLSGRLTFTLHELQRGLRLKGKSPACLEEVLEHCRREGVIMPKSDYADYLRSCESWLSWSQVTVKRSLSRIVPNPLSYFRRGQEDDTLFYVHMDHLKALFQRMQGEDRLKNKILSISQFSEQLRQGLGLEGDVDIVLSFAKSKNAIVTDKVGHEDVVLMGSEGSNNNKPPVISQVERGKYDVHRTKQILESSLEDLETKSSAAHASAKKALGEGKRNTAKHELRRKKVLEQRMEKVLNMIDNLTVIVMKIEDAESDAMIISAYEAGKKSLTSVLEENNLTVDRVTEAMLDIEDVLETQQEIASTISAPIDQEDTEQLDKELELLLQEDEDRKNLPPYVDVKSTEEDDDGEEEALRLLGELKVADGPLSSSPTTKDKQNSSVTSEL